jgi:ribosomal protein S20
MSDTAAIGELTAGGAANPQAQQEAADLIAAIEKRLNEMPAQTLRKQRTQISKIRNFWQQARDALNSGDIEGAKTLGTKAKLLLDDLDKQGGGGGE